MMVGFGAKGLRKGEVNLVLKMYYQVNLFTCINRKALHYYAVKNKS